MTEYSKEEEARIAIKQALMKLNMTEEEYYWKPRITRALEKHGFFDVHIEFKPRIRKYVILAYSDKLDGGFLASLTPSLGGWIEGEFKAGNCQYFCAHGNVDDDDEGENLDERG